MRCVVLHVCWMPTHRAFQSRGFDMQIVASTCWHDAITTHGTGNVSHMCADRSGLWQKCTCHAQASYARGTCLVPVRSTFQDGRPLQRPVFHRLREGTSPTSAPPASVQGGNLCLPLIHLARGQLQQGGPCQTQFCVRSFPHAIVASRTVCRSLPTGLHMYSGHTLSFRTLWCWPFCSHVQ